MKYRGFTLAEVLITLGIIGVVAALTISTLISNYVDKSYKVAYKKAFSDVNQAFQMLSSQGSLQRIEFMVDEAGNPRPGYSGAYGENFKSLAEYFKSTKTCFDGAQGDNCWKCKGGEQGDITNQDGNWVGTIECRGEYSFVDAQGRNWKMYSNNESIFLVDTNGIAGPNKLGKDRFPLRMINHSDGNQSSTKVPDTIRPSYTFDLLTKDRWCPSGECYYNSWLYK